MTGKSCVAILHLAIVCACAEGNSNHQPLNQTVDTNKTTYPLTHNCPHGHSDSIVPVIWGMPTKESFQKEDSGLVYLGGCEVSEREEKWFCKVHQILF